MNLRVCQQNMGKISPATFSEKSVITFAMTKLLLISLNMKIEIHAFLSEKFS